MNNKIKDTEKMETKNLESIPSENDLPDVKSKEHASEKKFIVCEG